MKIHKFLFCIFLILCCISAIAQHKKDNNLLKKYEISLLDILMEDSVADVNFTIPDYHFTFGLDRNIFTNIAVLKHRNQLFLQPLGTGRVYQVSKPNNTYKLTRIDSTFHTGANFFAFNFFNRDTLFQFGGIGFWNLRGIVTYYSNETHQWELYQSNKAINSNLEGFKGSIIAIDTTTNKTVPNLFTITSFEYSNFPQTFDIRKLDSCYKFDFNNRNWLSLGALTNDFIQIKENRNSYILQLGDYIYFASQLEFFWANMSQNKFGKLNLAKDIQLRQAWLDIYKSSNLKNTTTPFQFNIGNKLYLFIINDDELQIRKHIVTLNDFDLMHSKPIYVTSNNYFDNILNYWGGYKFSLVIIIFSCILVFVFITYLKRKNKLPKEVETILNQNFFKSLSITEKELIDVLYEHQLKGEELSTKLINKIIGVQQKDTLTQNKMRSDYFIRINQKYKLATQHQEPIIVKKRDAIDKRQYNYSLNPAYISEIEQSLGHKKLNSQ